MVIFIMGTLSASSFGLYAELECSHNARQLIDFVLEQTEIYFLETVQIRVISLILAGLHGLVGLLFPFAVLLQNS